MDLYSLANDALNSMAKYDLKPDPANYAVWYSFHTNDPLNLKLELENIIKSRKTVSDAVCKLLFQKHINDFDISSTIINTGESFAKELQDVITDIAKVNDTTKSFSDKLKIASSKLNGNLEPYEVHGVINSLSSDTQNMHSNTNALQENLTKSQLEIQNLKSELENARVAASKDGLTNIANRRSFDVFLDNAVKSANEKSSNLGMIIVDIDKFKQINDSWGHQTGDQVICFVANVIDQAAPKGRALASRIGGEEFALIVENTNDNELFAISESIRVSVETKKLVRRTTREYLGIVTVSLGVSTYISNEDKGTFINRCDEALYNSKNTGRNRVTFTKDGKSIAA